MKQLEPQHNCKISTFRIVEKRRSIIVAKTFGSSVVNLDSYRSATEPRKAIDELARDLTLLTKIMGC